jgi:RNA polymerase sigma factor (sigma-70 family)
MSGVFVFGTVRVDTGVTSHCACFAWPSAGTLPVAALPDVTLVPAGGPPRAFAAEPADAESSVELIRRIQAGDADTLDRLFARYLRPLSRWAHRRLPDYARSAADTQDVVQDGIVRVLGRLGDFQPQHPGGLHAYLRAAVYSVIIDHIRRAGRRPSPVDLDERLASALPSPHEEAVANEDRKIFEMALQMLSDGDRDLIIGRVEWGLDYATLSEAVGRKSADAARVATARAARKLAGHMQELRTPSSK